MPFSALGFFFSFFCGFFFFFLFFFLLEELTNPGCVRSESVPMDLLPPLVVRCLRAQPVFDLWMRGSLGKVRRKILPNPLLLIHGFSVGSAYRRSELEGFEDRCLC